MSSLARKRSGFFFSNADLSAPKGRILIMLSRSGQMSPSAIADKSSLTRATVTQQINELEQDGFIFKIKDGSDKRKIFIKLTEKGEKQFTIIDKKITEIEKDIGSIYTEEEQSQFDYLLTKGINYYKKTTKGANN